MKKNYISNTKQRKKKLIYIKLLLLYSFAEFNLKKLPKI